MIVYKKTGFRSNKYYKLRIGFVSLIVVLLMQSTTVLANGNFRAAVVKVDITPDSPKMLLGYNARQSTINRPTSAWRTSRTMVSTSGNSGMVKDTVDPHYIAGPH